MSSPSLYADLSHYYNVLCANINYQQQGEFLTRANAACGNAGKHFLDLGCGSGILLSHLYREGYSCSGLDISAAMLKLAAQRCPQAQLIQESMCNLPTDPPQDLISCFLYSIHYCPSIADIQRTFQQAFEALSPEGLFCFDAVDKNQIANDNGQIYTVNNAGTDVRFQSRWSYTGDSGSGETSSGDKMTLHLDIQERRGEQQFHYQERHAMTAVDFATLRGALVAAGFEVNIFEHDFSRLSLWNGETGNAIFCASKPRRL